LSNLRESLDIGEFVKAERHHPDITFGWGCATISSRTRKIKESHPNDFIMAAKIDRLTRKAEAQENSGQQRRPRAVPATSETHQSNDDRGSTLAHDR
jgi:hypothetical protein